MANLPEQPQWEDGIYQLETSDPVLAGPDGIDNRQATQLGNRTAYLKGVTDSLKETINQEDPFGQYLLREQVAAEAGALSWLGMAAGTVNALSFTLPEASKVSAYKSGQRFQFKVAAANTAAVTAKIGVLAEKPIFKGGNTGLVELDAGDLKPGVVYDLTFDGLQFQLGSGASSLSSALPVGAMVAFPVNNVAPGFLELDGSVRSIAAYPDLAAFLGTVFNKGDEGAGNFRLPESRGEFLRGWDHGRGVDAGRAIGSYQKGSLLSGNDDATAEVHAFYNVNTSRAGLGWDVPVIAEYSGSSGYGSSVFTSALFSQAHYGVARPRNLAVIWCIKAWNAPINQGVIDIAELAAQVQEVSVNGPVVGSMVGAKMTVMAASATATFTADEITVEDANGKTYRLKNFNQAINLASAVKGLGAMDVGAAPNNGYVAVYALYNPVTKAQGAMAVNATASVAPNLCAGVIPAGYTASALASVYPTNASGQFVVGHQIARKVYTPFATLLNTSVQQPSLTALSIAGYVPPNAKTVSGQLIIGPNSPGSGAMDVAGSASGIGGQYLNAYSLAGGGTAQAPFADLPIITAQTIYYIASGAAGSYSILGSAYTF